MRNYKYINQNNHNKRMRTRLGISILMMVVICECNQNILVLDKQNYSAAKQQMEYLFVYYYDQNCTQCQLTTQLFYTLHALSSSRTDKETQKQGLNQKWIREYDKFGIADNVQFCQIKFEGNQDIFKLQNIQAVPQFRIYKKNYNTIFRYPNIDLNYQNLQLLSLWVKRITTPYLNQFQSFQSLDKQQQNIKYAIIDCKYKQFINQLTQSQIYMNNLGVDFICVNNSGLKKYEILLKNEKYNKKLRKCIIQEQQNWRKCTNKIINYQYKQLIHWNDQIINQLFNNNHSVFVLITSNQSISQQYVRNITKIQQKLYQSQQQKGQQQEILPIFAVADIHYNLQQTIRIKRYIGGFDLKGWPYPYPIFAYLRLNKKGQVQKYIYQLKYRSSPKSKYTLEQWVPKAMRRELAKDIRGMNASKQMSLLSNTSDRSIYKIFTSQLSQLISMQKQNNPNSKTKPAFYLYVYWRSDWNMQLISSKVKRWWEGTKYNVSFYNFDLYDNELPQRIYVQTLPALIGFFTDGSHQIHEGVEDQSFIKKIIKEDIAKFNGD